MNLHNYATELSAGYAELRSTLATLAEELEAAKAAEAKARHDRSVSQGNKLLAKEKLEAAIKTYNEGVDMALAKNRGNIQHPQLARTAGGGERRLFGRQARRRGRQCAGLDERGRAERKRSALYGADVQGQSHHVAAYWQGGNGR
jgi:hypothetical protein